MTTPTSLQAALRPALSPLGRAWGALMRLRAGLYRTGRLASWEARAPVVSVGNIGWGGSGKTPVCQWIMELAQDRGLTGVVLTRGYGASPPRLPYLVEETSPPSECGDEPLLLARSAKSFRVVVDPKRSRSGPWAEDRFHPDLILLDDGFQHLAARRDVDLVLLTPHDLGEGWGRVIPAGSWREPEQALRRASAFLVKLPALDGPEAQAILQAAQDRLTPLGRPVFPFALEPLGLVGLDGVTPDATGAYLVATGVADPAQVAATAARYLGRGPEGLIPFPDHHAFTPADARRINEQSRSLGCRLVVCTAKDAVKLAGLGVEGLASLAVRPVFGPAKVAPPRDFSFAHWLLARIQETGSVAGGPAT